MTDDLHPRAQSALPRRLQRRLEAAREAELATGTPSASPSASPGPASPRPTPPSLAVPRSAVSRSAVSRSAVPRSAGPRSAEPRETDAVRAAGPRETDAVRAAGHAEPPRLARAALAEGGRGAPGGSDRADGADAASSVAPPRFIPSRNPQLAAREDERRRRLEEERAARSTSADIGLAPSTSTISPAERAARRARRRFVTLTLTAAAAVAALAFLLGAIADPFRARGPSAEELVASAVAHPQPTGVPAAALQAGECLASFAGAWASEFEPTACTGEHAAQLVANVPADPYTGGAYPGEDALRSRAQFACQATSVLDTAAAAAYEDLVVDVAYAPSALEWDAGQQSYSCFVARSGGGALHGSLAAS